MSTNFPGSLDTFTTPAGTATLGGSTPSHTTLHTNEGDAIEALQAKVGIDSSAVTTSLDYRVNVLESNTTAWFNVRDYGASPSASAAANDTAFAAAITAIPSTGGVLYIPAGTYSLNDDIALKSNMTVIGDGKNATILSQTNTASNGFTLSESGPRYVNISNLKLVGPNSGSGVGIFIETTTATASVSVNLSSVYVLDFGSHAVQSDVLITSVWQDVTAQSCGGSGFVLFSGTSMSLISCYANANTGNGYDFDSVSYSSLIACACDSSGGVGYLFDSCKDILVQSCGVEATTGNCYQITSSANITLNTCYGSGNNAIAVLAESGSTNAVIVGFREINPTGSATDSIQIDSGCTALVSMSNLTTAASYATGTTQQLTSTNMIWSGGDISISGVGKGLKVAEGANAKMGTATLVAGAATVATTAVTANSRIYLTSQADGGTPGWLRVDTRTAATSFHIQSSSGTDTSTVAWLIVEPS